MSAHTMVDSDKIYFIIYFSIFLYTKVLVGIFKAVHDIIISTILVVVL